MIEKKKMCLQCGKELLPIGGKLNPKRVFCDHTCSTRYNALRRHNKLKNNKNFKKKAKERFQKWAKENKEQQKENILKDYYRNKGKWKQRKFAQEHREKIMQFINPKCFCGKETKIIYNKKYGIFPTLKKGSGNEEEKLKIIKEYTKENLIGFCSQLCLQKEKAKRRKNG